MTSQTCLQTVAIDTLLTISQNKGNQTMKVGPFIAYNKIFFFKNYVENEGD